MKRFILAASALSMTLVAAPAFAQLSPVGPSAPSGTASQNVQVAGTVAGACGFGNQSGGGTAAASNVALGAITDGNGFLSVAEQEITFGNVWCNSGANLTLSATALSTSTAVVDTGSFTNKLDLVVSGKLIDTYFVGQSGAVARTGASLNGSIPAAFETGTGQYSKLKLNVALPTGTAGNDRPIAGAYTGTVTLKVSPNS